MAGKSLNRVQLIGNLTRDPELRYTPTGAAVCTLGLATNRTWTTDTGEKKEEVEYHRIVAWRKLAELCSQFLTKGRKVYIEGHLATRKWTAQDGQEKSVTEIIMDDMILIDSRRSGDEDTAVHTAPASNPAKPVTKAASKAKQNDEDASEISGDETVSPEDIPF